MNDGPAMRYDLDDLAGEICLLDWGEGLPSASRDLPAYGVLCGAAFVTRSRVGQFSALQSGALLRPFGPK